MWLSSTMAFLKSFTVFDSLLAGSNNWFLIGKMLFQVVTLFFSFSIFSNKPITFSSFLSASLDSSGTFLVGWYVLLLDDDFSIKWTSSFAESASARLVWIWMFPQTSFGSLCLSTWSSSISSLSVRGSNFYGGNTTISTSLSSSSDHPFMIFSAASSAE